MEGTILRYKQNTGRIKGDDNNIYKFNRRALQSGNEDGVVSGRRVRFEPEGNRARNVEILDEVIEFKKTDITKIGPQPPKPYRFLNPYNFVRYLDQARPSNDTLGNCLPPPHDRYVGLSGRITCELTAQTPLFISDSEGVEPDKKHPEHKHYRFFRLPNDEGVLEEALPATSLRGMLRSVFEAATNSCFGVFSGSRLSKHLAPQEALKLVPGRIEPKPREEKDADTFDENKKEWVLRLLPGTTQLQVGLPPRGKQYAAWIHRYWPTDASKTLLKRKRINRQTREFQARTTKGTEISLHDMKHGEDCYALLEQRQHPHPHVRFWDVIEVSKDEAELTRKCRTGQRVEYGWLCLNNQNIEVKHSERFFFRAKKNTNGRIVVAIRPEVVHEYEELIADYQKRHANAVQTRRENEKALDKPIKKRKNNQVIKEVALSRFIYQEQEREVKGGELVYAMLRGTRNKPYVEFMVPVSVPRVTYNYSINDLLSEAQHVRPCQDYQTLCPACRVFGWVHQDATKLDPDIPVAYAGRVRLSHGKLAHSEGTVDDPQKGITLAILSGPKPTTTQFYLLKDGRPDKNVTYDDKEEGAQLRGRKVYRHHGEEPSRHVGGGYEYERATDKKHDGKDDQNRTVHGVLKKGAKFEFTLEFENLAKEELGALLWVLEMEEGMHHRLGYAKPLGFGSVTIKIKEVQTLQVQERYHSLTANGGWNSITETEWKKWVEAFQDKMVKAYGKGKNASFTKLQNISELKALTSQPNIAHIHYPRKERQPNPEGKNFEWFTNKKKQTLGLATSDSGLSLK